MSGTSLDGLDMVICTFWKQKDKWQYRIEKATTIAYSGEWRIKLHNAFHAGAYEITLLDREYGRWIGRQAAQFMKGIKVDFIASHGHTVFHRPDQKCTLQIGHAAAIVAETGLPVVSDFRSLDVALGGQGAPLVPVGDELLFSGYDYCLNLGGFANISCRKNEQRTAWDICPVNIILNKLAPPFDKDGRLGKKGECYLPLREELDALEFYQRTPPKSLGREWLENIFEKILETYPLSLEDKLSTLYDHIAHQITKSIDPPGNVLVTGGGAWNTFLLEKLKSKSNSTFILPDEITVNFKEALVFAFLGLLRINSETNCLASVTGASRDSSSGTITHL